MSLSHAVSGTYTDKILFIVYLKFQFSRPACVCLLNLETLGGPLEMDNVWCFHTGPRSVSPLSSKSHDSGIPLSLVCSCSIKEHSRAVVEASLPSEDCLSCCSMLKAEKKTHVTRWDHESRCSSAIL